jgi:hypothetical protein
MSDVVWNRSHIFYLSCCSQPTEFTYIHISARYSVLSFLNMSYLGKDLKIKFYHSLESSSAYTRLSFIATPVTASLTHWKVATIGTYRERCCAEDWDKQRHCLWSNRNVLHAEVNNVYCKSSFVRALYQKPLWKKLFSINGARREDLMELWNI